MMKNVNEGTAKAMGFWGGMSVGVFGLVGEILKLRKKQHDERKDSFRFKLSNYIGLLGLVAWCIRFGYMVAYAPPPPIDSPLGRLALYIAVFLVGAFGAYLIARGIIRYTGIALLLAFLGGVTALAIHG